MNQVEDKPKHKLKPHRFKCAYCDCISGRSGKAECLYSMGKGGSYASIHNFRFQDELHLLL